MTADAKTEILARIRGALSCPRIKSSCIFQAAMPVLQIAQCEQINGNDAWHSEFAGERDGPLEILFRGNRVAQHQLELAHVM